MPSLAACNCAYGPQDPRCCIAKARRAELEEAHRLGREGKPLPEDREPPPSIASLNVVRDDIARLNAIRL
ncbi:hypothetical protein EV580_1294 [Mycobacterium sp. BK086]|uniref:hypothetical protein n=1 Tax=Mycobacterium sp. BK086 TaxID=2512165 RepID=UPI00105BEBA2|nr:hypothetical protein [Mycobacterium sp. BK086]TDO18112.1 hypothetical protein EV580_1294 [Mycobacterium sp. BK086]